MIKKYNLKQLVEMSLFDFYNSTPYYYTRKNLQPIRNLFRKKENKKFVEGWVYALDFKQVIIQEKDINKSYTIINGKCFEKPKIRLFFTDDIIFHRHFDTYTEVVDFAEMISKKAMTDNDYFIEL